MMLQIKRIYSIVLVVLLCVAWCTSGVNAARTEEYGATDNYVLVLDMSAQSDFGDICTAALEMVLDMLPAAGVKVGVIAYGSQDGNAYGFSNVNRSFAEKAIEEAKHVRLVHPLEEYTIEADDADRLSVRDKIMEQFGAIRNQGNRSPHEVALLAAVDMLEQADTQSGRGNVILISDGSKVAGFGMAVKDCQNHAVQLAKDKGWPVWTIRLDVEGAQDRVAEYGIGETREDFEKLKEKLKDKNLNNDKGFPTIFMRGMAYETGAHQFSSNNTVKRQGTWLFEGGKDDPDSMKLRVYSALQQIMGGNSEIQRMDGNGRYNHPVPVTSLVGEEVICISGTDLESITVRIPDNDGKKIEHTFTSSGNIDSISVQRRDLYFIVRILRPKPGDWEIEAQGKAGSTVRVYRAPACAPDMEIGLNQSAASLEVAADGKYSIDRNSSLVVYAEFTYLGKPVYLSEESTYENLEIKMEVLNEDGQQMLDSQNLQKVSGSRMESKEFVMAELHEEERQSGRLESDTCTVQVVMTDTVTDKIIAEKTLKLSCSNQPATILKGEYTVEEQAFHPIEINLTEHIDFGSGRPLTYSISNDQSDGVDFLLIDGEKEVSTMTTAMQMITLAGIGYDGYYEPTLKVLDGNDEIGTIKLCVSVERPKIGVEPREVNVYDLDWWGLQQTQTLQLSGEFEDVEITAEPEGIVTALYNPENGTVEITGSRPDTGQITLMVKEHALFVDDDKNTQNRVTELYVPVNVASAVKKYMPWMLLSVFILTVCVVIAIRLRRFCRKASMIRGSWDLTLEFPGCDAVAIKDWWIHVDGRDDYVAFEALLKRINDAMKNDPFMLEPQKTQFENLVNALSDAETGIRFYGVFGARKYLRITDISQIDSPWKMDIAEKFRYKDVIVQTDEEMPEIRIVKTKKDEKEVEFGFTMRLREL